MTMEDTIVAVSTPHGMGGIAVVRVSGGGTLAVVGKVWQGKDLASVPSHTAHLGNLIMADGSVLDNAVATVFRGPNSFTGEDTVEFSLHGSKWIQREAVRLLVEAGARVAHPGEFTRRAFVNGRLDLAQAEAVADVIAASSRASHKLALQQLSGSFSQKLRQLRQSLIDLASLLELELDFSEEDVEFADRTKLKAITSDTLAMMRKLADSYSSGKAFKEGVPVVIAGSPNAGKSTLLNVLLNEEKAIVTDIPGTTRDIIEDTKEIEGVLFRFYDTAGLRESEDRVEMIGIEKAKDAISKASIVLWVIDASLDEEVIRKEIEAVNVNYSAHLDKKHLVLFNKTDRSYETFDSCVSWLSEQILNFPENVLRISAKNADGINNLQERLVTLSKSEYDPENEMIVTNARHYEALLAGSKTLERVKEGLDSGLSADLIAQDLREALHHLSELTGEVSTDTLLSTIFSRFCIGK